MSSTPFYLGPGRPPVQIATWQQLCAAVDAGVMQENQWVEHKEDIPKGARGGVELAKDLASLSVEGGVYVVGAVDKIGDASGLVGVDNPDGLRERIGQIAENRIKPPLNVVVDTLTADDEDAHPQPCLLVTVPASAAAPHMVEDRYWGRSATGKRPLVDSEVRRLIAERVARTESFTQRLLAMSHDFDPVPEPARRFGHIYLYARPRMTPAIPVTEPLAPNHPVNWLREHLPGRPEYSRTMTELLEFKVPHAAGLMVTSWHPDRAERAEEYAMQLLLEDDGGLRVTSCEGTREWEQGKHESPCISPHYHLELAHQVVVTAAAILSTYASYRGMWDIGVHVTGLAGCPSTAAMNNVFGVSRVCYQEPSYTSVTEASTDEMLNKTPAVVERLYRRFARGLGLETVFFPYTEFDDIQRRGRS